MTKQTKQFEISVSVGKENGRVQEIADIVVRFYKEALIKAQIWQENPVTLIVVVSDEKTLLQLLDSLSKELKADVIYRVAPHYLYEN